MLYRRELRLHFQSDSTNELRSYTLFAKKKFAISLANRFVGKLLIFIKRLDHRPACATSIVQRLRNFAHLEVPVTVVGTYEFQ